MKRTNRGTGTSTKLAKRFLKNLELGMIRDRSRRYADGSFRKPVDAPKALKLQKSS